MTLTTPSMDLAYYRELDAKLVVAASTIKVLSCLAWPARIYQDFIEAWQHGQPKLPVIEHPRIQMSDRCFALEEVVKAAGSGHPIGDYIAATAQSYISAARMLENLGTAEFSQLSQELYGTPHELNGPKSNLSLADEFLHLASNVTDAEDASAQSVLSPEQVAAELGQVAVEFFRPHKVSVVVDQNITAKAAAGAERIRIRGMTTFTRAEVDQLREHELYVHSATRLNGREQPYLKSLALGAPRTVTTQEGLATYAELITATMDMGRLRRIAMRIRAIAMALDGGDFIDVFRFFLESGQSERESFQSTARVFRGGDVRGRHAFTKDVVYLKGLISVHNFLVAAFGERKFNALEHLFLGRLALPDITSLREFVVSGLITPPRFLPPWARGLIEKSDAHLEPDLRVLVSPKGKADLPK